MISMLVAVDQNWGIGKEGDLLVKIPEDMKFFKEISLNNVVIMGRKTFESLPNRKPLNDRINIIITTDKEYQAEGAIVVHSIEEALEKAKEFKDKEIINIGGGKIFNQMLDHCDIAYVTYIDKVFEADTYCPRIDQKSEWELESESEDKYYQDLKFRFRKYRKK